MNLLATPFARRRPKSPRPVHRLAGQRRPAGLDRGESLERRNLLAILAGGVERTTPDDFFTDFSAGLTSEYTAYTITNDASGPAADVWVKAVFPGGSPVGVGTGYNREDGLYRVGTLPPSTSGTAFLYFTANALSAAPVPYSIEVYNGEPGNGGALVVTKPFSLTTVVNTLAAEPNKVDTVSYSPASPQIGDTLTLSVTGRLGNGANRVLFAPASGTAWEPDVFELRSTSHTISGIPQTPNGLFYDGLPGLVNQQPFSSTYQFLITRASDTATLTSPTQFTQDGEQDWKHHKPDPTPFPTIPPIPPRLTLTKNDGVTTYVPGGTTIYTIVLSNTDAGAATGVVVSDILPPQLNAAATTWTVSYSNATGTLPANGSGNIGGTVNLAALSGVVTITINGVILSSALGDMTNTVTATVSGTTVTASDTNTAAPLANLTISKTDATTTVTAGGGTIQTYTLRVRNLGLSDARNVVVSDSWPAGFLQGAFGGPSQGTVIPGVGGNFSWSLGTLAAGVEATLTVTYTVPASTLPGDYVNTATVTSTTPDPDPNNTATDTTSVVTSANLSITKTDLVTTVTAGGGTVQTYTLAVRNNGASDARNVVVGDVWPAGFAQGAFGIPSQGTVTPGVGGNFTWSLGTLAAGAEATLTVSYTVPASTLPGLYSNTATVTSTTSDPDPINNTATDTTTVVASANLTVEKTDDTTVVLAGGGTVQTYTLRVRNNGVSDARNVSVNDVWPAGFAQGAFGIPSQGTVTPGVGGNFTWSLGTLAAGAEATLTVSYTVPASTLPGLYVNTATVTSTTPDPDPNNTATDTTTVIASANLTIAKTDSTSTVTAGDGMTHTYVIAVRNNGASDARNVSVADVWPAGFAQGAFGIPSQGTVTPGVGGNFTWSLGTLAAGAEATLTVSYTVPASTLPGPYVNTATVTSTTPDPDPNNTATDTTTVIVMPDLAIMKTDEVAIVTAGGGTTQTYTITVQNNGVSDSRGVVVNDVWPTGFSQGAFGIPSQGTVTPGIGGNFTWSVGTLAAGSQATLTVTYTVAANVLPGPYINTAAVTSDDDREPHTATDTTVVVASADLIVSKTDSTTTVIAGGGTVQTYVLRVRNGGVSDSQNVVLADAWPAGFTQIAFDAPSQGIVTPGVGGDFTWSIGTLPAGQEATLEVSYVVPASTLPGPYVNTATVSSETIDPDPDNTATDTTTVVASADLTITKDDATATVLAGGGTVQTYTLTVRNNGASDARDVAVADAWPEGFLQATLGIPTQGTVTPGVAGDFTWTLGTLVAGGQATLQVTYTVPASTLPGPYVNTATVASSTPDPDPNNTATDTTTVVTSADLTITKDDSMTTVTAGGGSIQTYVITVRNNGASDAQAVAVEDAWPAGFQQGLFGGPSQGTVAPGIGGNFTWSVGTLAAGSQATLTVTYTVPASTLPGAYVNTATVTSLTPDPDPNNTATDTTTVVALADLSITKTDSVGTVVAGGGTVQTYTLRVRNNGLGFSDAQDVVVIDTWPAGFTQGAFGIPSQGTVTPGVGGNFTWTLGTLPQDAEATLTVTYTVPSSTAPGLYTNTATVTSPTPDPDPNNTATDTTTVIAGVDLTVSKTGDLTYKAGGPLNFTVVVTNLGPSFASGVRVVDALPTGVVSWSWTVTYTGASSGTADGSPDSVASSTAGIDKLMNLAVLGTATFTITALTQTGFTSDISNTATATIGDESATATWTSAYDGPINPTADVGALVLGTDDGCNLASWVKVIDPIVGATLVEFLAYEPSFLGSVRVATGDLTGDGLDEIVVAPGRSRVGEVRVFTQQGVELPEYRLLPFSPAYLGGVEVAVGDVNGDGVNDIIAGQSSGAGRVSAFLVNSTAIDPVANVPYRAFRPFPSPYALGVMIAAGDFGTYSGGVKTSPLPDGRAEIVVGTNAGTRAQVRIYDASTATPKLVKTILPFASTFQGGVTLSTGRYNFDDIDDVMIGAGVGGNSAVEVYDGATWALRKKIDAFAAFGRPNAAVFAAMLDLDGDGRANDVYGVQGRNATGGSNGVRRWNRITTATNILPATTALAPPLRIASIVLRVPNPG